jgi:hypothetical protein
MEIKGVISNIKLIFEANLRLREWNLPLKPRAMYVLYVLGTKFKQMYC